VTVTPAELGRLLGREVSSVVPAGDGYDNQAYLVDGRTLVRVAKDTDAEATRREAAVLRAVRAAVAVPVPEPEAVRPEEGLLAYPALPGRPLADLPLPPPPGVVPALARLLDDLHAMPLPALRALGVPDDDTAPAEWREEAAETYERVSGEIPAAYRAAVAAFLVEPPPEPARRLVFGHQDLGAEHVLVDPESGTVTGVIDWTDAAIGDPAVDAGRLHRDLGPSWGPVDGRARFYARCAALEDFEFGLRTGRERYVRNSLRAFGWLFS